MWAAVSREMQSVWGLANLEDGGGGRDGGGGGRKERRGVDVAAEASCCQYSREGNELFEEQEGRAHHMAVYENEDAIQYRTYSRYCQLCHSCAFVSASVPLSRHQSQLLTSDPR